MTVAAPLTTFRLERGVSIAQARPPNSDAVTWDSPALEVMTDLTEVRAATTHPATSLRQAEQMMIYQGVRMLFVVTEMPRLDGLITSTDLHGERQMGVVHSRQLRFDEMRVADVMTELSMLDAIEFERMGGVTVSNLVTTLKDVSRNHLLVVQKSEGAGPPRVRGVISRAQIERQLGRPIEVAEVAVNFAEVVRALR